MGVPQLMVRFMSARSEKSLVPAMVISVTVILLFDLGAVLTGMAGRALFPGLEDPESILPVISTTLLHPVLGGIMMVVVLAAIMSTVDSLLILASSAVVRDYWQQVRGSSAERPGAGQPGQADHTGDRRHRGCLCPAPDPTDFLVRAVRLVRPGAAFGPVLCARCGIRGLTWQGPLQACWAASSQLWCGCSGSNPIL